MCSPLARPAVQPAGPPFCAAGSGGQFMFFIWQHGPPARPALRLVLSWLSIVLSSRPMICAFADALRVNTETVETQLSQVSRRFNRSPCASGFSRTFASRTYEWMRGSPQKF